MKASSFTLLASLEFGVVLMCLFSIFYLATTDWKKNRWLILAFLVFGLPIFIALFGQKRYGLIGYNPFILNPAPLLLLFPALYFYTYDLVKPNVATPLSRAVHTIPFFLFYITNSIVGFEFPNNMMINDAKRLLLILFILTSLSVALFYSYLILRLVWLNQHKYQNQYAESNIFLTLNWMKWMIYIIIFMPIIGAFGNVLLWEELKELSTFPFTITMLITCCTLAYFSFRQQTLYKENLPNTLKPNKPPIQISRRTTLSQKNKAKQNTSSISLSESEKMTYITLIEAYMKEEQPFLNSKIRMPELAKSLKIPRHIFSYLINEHYKMNFFYFINQYRIEYAKELLLDKENEFYTLETIGQMAGFNSKSTFNTRFKELVGKSPMTFKKDENK